MNVKELFEVAIKNLRRELPSFGKEVGERTLMARLAHHMALLVETNDEGNDLKVDCEYNRNVDEIKMMPCAKEDDSGSKSHRCFPDIILHRRGDDSQNLLVCEIKNNRVRGKRKPTYVGLSTLQRLLSSTMNLVLFF